MSESMVKGTQLLISAVGGNLDAFRNAHIPTCCQPAFELLYRLGFMLGLKDADYGNTLFTYEIQVYLQLTGNRTIHEYFIVDLPNIDPCGICRQHMTGEVFTMMTTGENMEFGFRFMMSGYYSAIYATGEEDSVYARYQDKGIEARCKFLYWSLFATEKELRRRM